jgi:hypothetical protein
MQRARLEPMRLFASSALSVLDLPAIRCETRHWGR